MTPFRAVAGLPLLQKVFGSADTGATEADLPGRDMEFVEEEPVMVSALPVPDAGWVGGVVDALAVPGRGADVVARGLQPVPQSGVSPDGTSAAIPPCVLRLINDHITPALFRSRFGSGRIPGEFFDGEWVVVAHVRVAGRVGYLKCRCPRNEHQRQHIVVDGVGFEQRVHPRGLGVEIACQHSEPHVARGPSPKGIDGPPAANGEQPSRRLGRHPVHGPGDECLRECLLRDIARPARNRPLYRARAPTIRADSIRHTASTAPRASVVLTTGSTAARSPRATRVPSGPTRCPGGTRRSLSPGGSRSCCPP